MEKVNEILRLCFQINEFEQRQKEKTGDKSTISIEFSGRCAELQLVVFEKRWCADKKKKIKLDKFMCLYLDKEDVEKELDSWIKYLKELKERENDEYL